MVGYDYSCYNAGATPCGFHTRTTNEAELRAEIEKHLVKVHNVKTPTQTIVNYLVKTAKRP